MAEHDVHPEVKNLAPFVGEWTMEPKAEWAPPDTPARITMEWLSGEQFLVQRWEIPIPVAPDGIAIIGYDEGRGTLLQHYFDSRGVARIYEMTFDEGVWKLSRSEADYSPLDFSQRFTGTFSDDGKTIDGTWEISHDHSTWEKDFDLVYTKVPD